MAQREWRLVKTVTYLNCASSNSSEEEVQLVDLVFGKTGGAAIIRFAVRDEPFHSCAGCRMIWCIREQ